MRMLVGLALLLLASSAYAAPETPKSPAPVAPEPDITPMKVMGAQARAKNGPEPLAVPSADLGMTPDPDDMAVPEKVETPVVK